MSQSDFGSPVPFQQFLTPNPALSVLLATWCRSIGSGLSAIGVVSGPIMPYITDDVKLQAVVTMVLTIGGTVTWIYILVSGYFKNKKAAKDNHDSSVASAVASANATQKEGRPIVVVVPTP